MFIQRNDARKNESNRIINEVYKRITLPYLSILRIFVRCVMSPGYREWRVIFDGKLGAPSTFSNKSYSIRSAIWISWRATPVIRVPLERLSYLFFAPPFVCSFLNDFPQRSPPYTSPSPIDHTQSPRTRFDQNSTELNPYNFIRI